MLDHDDRDFLSKITDASNGDMKRPCRKKTLDFSGMGSKRLAKNLLVYTTCPETRNFLTGRKSPPSS